MILEVTNFSRSAQHPNNNKNKRKQQERPNDFPTLSMTLNSVSFGASSPDASSIWHSVSGAVSFAIAVTTTIWLTADHLDGKFGIYGHRGRVFDYPWRLAEPDFADKSAWLGYSLHNLSAWGIIWAARNQRKNMPFNKKYSKRWSWPNWSMLAVHVVFAALHILQTRYWYDGLARDVPEITSLASVALMLIVILALENPRRGFILGKQCNFPQTMKYTLKEFHGYFFTWALIYTFWYHPTTGSHGHLWGFFYMMMLLWQSVLVYTRDHLNRKWSLALELMVIPHSVAVAYQQGNGLTNMFFFGFTGTVLLSQVYTFKVSSTIHRALWLGYIVLVLAAYSYQQRLAKVHEILRIPLINSLIPMLLAGFFWTFEKILNLSASLMRRSSKKTL